MQIVHATNDIYALELAHASSYVNIYWFTQSISETICNLNALK